MPLWKKFMQLGIESGPAFIALMRRYCIDYVNCHNQAVTRDIMEEDYLLRMGDHQVRGRDTAYSAATARQMQQFPGLMLTVHEIATSGDRLMMRFSEHGRRASDGALCAWGGIGLYRWNGKRLTANNVEQDYWSRRRQIDDALPDRVDHPHLAPWDVTTEAPDPAAEATVRAWLAEGRLADTPGVYCDDAWLGRTPMRALDQQRIEVNDLFSVGSRVAFHVTQSGLATDDMPSLAKGAPADLHGAGIIHVKNGQVAAGRIIRNRLSMARGV